MNHTRGKEGNFLSSLQVKLKLLKIKTSGGGVSDFLFHSLPYYVVAPSRQKKIKIPLGVSKSF